MFIFMPTGFHGILSLFLLVSSTIEQHTVTADQYTLGNTEYRTASEPKYSTQESTSTQGERIQSMEPTTDRTTWNYGNTNTDSYQNRDASKPTTVTEKPYTLGSTKYRTSSETKYSTQETTPTPGGRIQNMRSSQTTTDRTTWNYGNTKNDGYQNRDTSTQTTVTEKPYTSTHTEYRLSSELKYSTEGNTPTRGARIQNMRSTPTTTARTTWNYGNTNSFQNRDTSTQTTVTEKPYTSTHTEYRHSSEPKYSTQESTPTQGERIQNMRSSPVTTDRTTWNYGITNNDNIQNREIPKQQFSTRSPKWTGTARYSTASKPKNTNSDGIQNRDLPMRITTTRRPIWTSKPKYTPAKYTKKTSSKPKYRTFKQRSFTPGERIQNIRSTPTTNDRTTWRYGTTNNNGIQNRGFPMRTTTTRRPKWTKPKYTKKTSSKPKYRTFKQRNSTPEQRIQNMRSSPATTDRTTWDYGNTKNDNIQKNTDVPKQKFSTRFPKWTEGSHTTR